MSEVKEKLHENRICSIVGQDLVKSFPGWKWWVECRLHTGLVSVRNLDLDGDYGFYVPVDKAINPDSKAVMRAGGEILERYRQDRAKRPEFVDVTRDFRGKAKGDIA